MLRQLGGASSVTLPCAPPSPPVPLARALAASSSPSGSSPCARVPPPPPRILHERRRRGARVSNPVSSSPSLPLPLHLPHSSLFLSPDPATATSSSKDPTAATSSPTDLAAAPSSSVDLAVERPDPAVDLHHGHDAGTSTTAGEDASARRDPRGGTGIREEASAWSPASDWRGGGGRGKPGSVAGGLENGLAGGLLVFFLFF